MISEQFLRQIDGYRRVDTRRGDSLQAIALRELGDASRWIDLALLNGLAPPYITDDAALASDTVLLSGAQIMVPAPQQSATTSPEAVYLSDVQVRNRRLDVDGDGGLALVSGATNLVQALRHRLLVEKRELLFHPEYGCYAQRLLGGKVTPQTARLVAFYVRSALLEDERVADVAECVAEARGDAIFVTALVVPISGRSIQIEVTL